MCFGSGKWEKERGWGVAAGRSDVTVLHLGEVTSRYKYDCSCPVLF